MEKINFVKIDPNSFVTTPSTSMYEIGLAQTVQAAAQTEEPADHLFPDGMEIHIKLKAPVGPDDESDDAVKETSAWADIYLGDLPVDPPDYEKAKKLLIAQALELKHADDTLEAARAFEVECRENEAYVKMLEDQKAFDDELRSIEWKKPSQPEVIDEPDEQNDSHELQDDTDDNGQAAVLDLDVEASTGDPIDDASEFQGGTFSFMGITIGGLGGAAKTTGKIKNWNNGRVLNKYAKQNRKFAKAVAATERRLGIDADDASTSNNGSSHERNKKMRRRQKIIGGVAIGLIAVIAAPAVARVLSHDKSPENNQIYTVGFIPDQPEAIEAPSSTLVVKKEVPLTTETTLPAITEVTVPPVAPTPPPVAKASAKKVTPTTKKPAPPPSTAPPTTKAPISSYTNKPCNPGEHLTQPGEVPTKEDPRPRFAGKCVTPVGK